MEQLTPQLMHKLVFTVLMHGLNDSQTSLALKVLAEALEHPNAQVRELAVVALADLPVAASKKVPVLMIGLTDPSARVRRRAARALGDQGAAAQAALHQLAEGLHDADASVRRDCAGAIGRIGPGAHPVADGLIPHLDDPEARSRAVAAVALKRIGTAAVPALVAGVRGGSAERRGRCAALLCEIAPNDPQVRAVLKTSLTHEQAETVARADVTLKAVSTPMPMPMPRLRGESPVEV